MVQELQKQESSLILVLIFATIFLALTSLGLILFFVFSRRKIIQKEQEKAILKIEHQQKIMQTSIAIQEVERKRIAQDLHDAISSNLNVVSLTTNVLLADKTLEKKQKETLEQILEITSGTLENSRRIAHDLLPPILGKFGLKAALEELFDEFCRNTDIVIQHDVIDLQLTDANQLHVFRILQELINNSIRHGEANELVVFMENNPEGFSLRYQDNGKGFNVEEVAKNSGLGIQNIKSRVNILRGTIQIESAINKGSRFIIQCCTDDI